MTNTKIIYGYNFVAPWIVAIFREDFSVHNTAQDVKFSVMDISSKYDQITVLFGWLVISKVAPEHRRFSVRCS